MLFVTFPYMFLKYKSRTIPIRDVRAHFRFISFLCSALLFSVFCFLGNQGDFDKRIANQTNERTSCASWQFFLLLFAANVRAWVTLEQAVKRTFLRVCVLCTLKCFEACFGFDLSCATLRMCNFNYVQQLSSSCSSTYGQLIWSVVRFAYYASKLSGCCRSCVQRGVWAMCNRRAIARDNATEREWENVSKGEREGEIVTARSTQWHFICLLLTTCHTCDTSRCHAQCM